MEQRIKKKLDVTRKKRQPVQDKGALSLLLQNVQQYNLIRYDKIVTF